MPMPRIFLLRPTALVLALSAAACVAAPVTTVPAPVGPASGPARADGGAMVIVRADTGADRQTPPRLARDSTVSTTDVSLETMRVFGDSVAPPPIAGATEPGVPVWDIDVRSYETKERVEDYVRIFSGRAKGVFATALQRQTRYGPMMRERLKARGLPENLTYLALVESWFNPHAYSKAAAVGIWQFMAGTARGMGLRVDWWVDERRDPVRSTEAAARMLLGLRGQFGSLYLAAAAYNGGGGRVSRGLARYADALDGVQGEDRFFALAEQSYLRPETRDYVPKIIAAALVGEQPERYGVVVESLPPYSYDSVRVGGGVPLAAVANAAGRLANEVDELNPHILRGMTPPSDAMWVRVPTGSAEGFADRYAALEPAERRALARVESKKGQSMASIAKAHGLTTHQLTLFNAKLVRLKSGNLRAGQLLLVPRADVARMARDVPNPSIEKYPKRRAKSPVKRGTTKAAVKKPAAKKSAVKKPAVKKPAVKKPSVSTTTVKKPAVKSAVAKKPAAKQP